MRLRITLVVSLIASIGMLGLTCFVLRPQLEELRRERTELVKQRDQHLLAAGEARERVRQANAHISELELKLGTAHQQLETTLTENLLLQRSNQQSVRELENTRAELLAKGRRLAEWDVLGLTPGQVLLVVNTNQSLRRAVAELSRHNEKLSRQYAEIIKKIEHSEDVMPEMPPVTGKIVALDQKWNFVVLNVGEDQGLKTNGVLLVARDSTLLGKLRITRVEGDRSIADFLPGSDIAAIREGDHVFN